MSELRPLNNDVLLIPYKEKVHNGVILTPTAYSQQLPIFYIVSAIGNEVSNPDLKEGTIVVIPRKTGRWVPFEGFKYILVNENDILAIVEDAEYISKEKLEMEDNVHGE